jgi:hypothetical protein
MSRQTMLNRLSVNTPVCTYVPFAQVASFVSTLIEHIGARLPGTRELERLYPIVVQYLSEGNAEPRMAGKKAILVIHEHTVCLCCCVMLMLIVNMCIC